MAKIEPNKIKQMFEYLYNSTDNLEKVNGTIVFGRVDPLLAKKAAKIHNKGKTEYLLFTGGVGKDSGYLTDLKISEANWQAALANVIYRIPQEKIYIEPNATNGGDNCRFSIDTILDKGLPHENMLLLAHPTALRRLHATMEVITSEKQFQTNYQRIGTDYLFNPKNPLDQQEAIAEILKLADWPAKGWCTPQTNMPLDLVEYARTLK